MGDVKIVPAAGVPPPAQTESGGRDSKMLEAARGFENQFVRQLIAEMRKTVPDDSLIPESFADKIYREQLDNEYADKWVQQGGIGLADIIYEQLNEKYGHTPQLPAKASGEFLKFSNSRNEKPERPVDVLSHSDGGLFLAKKLGGGFIFKSRHPLAQPVKVHAPLSGQVLQSARLEDGRNMIVLKHDQGLVTQFVHSGSNRVKNGMEVNAGDVIATLPSASKDEAANVFFELRKAAKTE